MKIAVISDIHGNMEALKAVLEDIETKGHDQIFCLGDYAMAGPEPDKSVDFFMTKDYTMIQGNTDLMIANYSEEVYNAVKGKAPVMAEALKCDSELLSTEQKEFLKNLPAQKEVEIEEVKILLVHGSPRRNNEDILPTTPLKQVEEMLENVNADVILCGHTHLPCGFQTTKKQTVVNAGSVGRPFTDNPESCYLTMKIENGSCIFEHNFVNYDKELASKKLSERTFTGSNKLADMLLNPKVRHF